MQHSYLVSSRGNANDSLGLSQHNTKFLYNQGDEEKNNYIFHTYISGVDDVLPNGNCGFWSLVVALGLDENQWPFK
jgi:hypothetical protein